MDKHIVMYIGSIKQIDFPNQKKSFHLSPNTLYEFDDDDFSFLSKKLGRDLVIVKKADKVVQPEPRIKVAAFTKPDTKIEVKAEPKQESPKKEKEK